MLKQSVLEEYYEITDIEFVTLSTSYHVVVQTAYWFIILVIDFRIDIYWLFLMSKSSMAFQMISTSIEVDVYREL